ncbi:gamma-glutamyltransferase [Elioraea sp.]|uniref:gamma-glutamyltransferase n=1 Tax=Elioraea sp. TaxID=2185103 RepID=UPI003F72A8D9
MRWVPLVLLLIVSAAGAREPATAARHMVAAAHPLAAEAGREVLRHGGAAIDAAVAVQAVLGLVEPQSSGIGGGAFILHWDAAARSLVAWDGRETAPSAATPDLFLRPDGTPMPFLEAAHGGRAVGVPGAIAALEAAHRAHGQLPWAELFAPAITLAGQGFAVSPRLAAAIAADRERLARDPATRAYFLLPDGAPLPEGHMLRNPAYAATLHAIAVRGAAALRDGPVAEAIVAAVRGADWNPGRLTASDLAAYRTVPRDPVCVPYRAWRVCGMGPPSSGGIAVGQILGLIAHTDMVSLDPRSPDAAHWLAEAGRLAFADRNLYVADADKARVPVRGLLDPAYLTARAQLIDRDRANPAPKPGNPPWREATGAPDAALRDTGTSHVSILDAAGNAVAMTTTIEAGFGARIMAAGFLLNNQLTDFSFRPEIDGRPVANRVEPGKRPRSSMAPTMVFDPQGELRVILGSPGGALIIGYVAQTLVAILDWAMDPQAAIDLPRVLTAGGPVLLEDDTEAAGLKSALEARGHTVTVRPTVSGLHAIVVTARGITGGADRRREGVVLGD